MAKQKYYVVWKGRRSGIYNTWEACSAQVTGFVDAEYKSFESKSEAEKALAGAYSDYVRAPHPYKPAEKSRAAVIPRKSSPSAVVMPSICVDAACAGVPGPLEWQGVETASGKVLFKMGPYPDGTNNIGEFLAIIQGLGWLKKNKFDWPLYSDSSNAILWVKLKKCRTRMKRTPKNEALFELIASAETWLRENHFGNKILKWETHAWGENPADFGRK